MTGKFLSEQEQTELEIAGDVAVWYSPSVAMSQDLKERVQILARWIRQVANTIKSGIKWS